MLSQRNARAWASIALGVLALAALPVALEAANVLKQLTLPTAVASAAAAGIVLALASITFARRARFAVELSLGRLEGRRAARIGHALGVLGLCVGITAALAVGFYAVLLHFQ
ncbi:MAG: hypothetical protein WBB74_10230 [Gaiellaceae bacterium]